MRNPFRRRSPDAHTIALTNQLERTTDALRIACDTIEELYKQKQLALPLVDAALTHYQVYNGAKSVAECFDKGDCPVCAAAEDYIKDILP